MQVQPFDATIPSRHSNPFATCWTRPGALPPLLPDGLTIGALVERLRASDWRGEIVGPHGSGKSTLLASLAPAVARAAPTHVTTVDGFDELAWRVRHRLRWKRAGLLATTHRGAGLPLLCRMTPSRDQLCVLFDRLTAGRGTPVTLADALDLYNRCNGNVRDVWFELYLMHERREGGLRSTGRPAVVACWRRRLPTVVSRI